MIHHPVMSDEVCEFLLTNLSGSYFDGTAGFGGHIEVFLQKLSSDAVIVATDQDETAFSYCKKKFAGDPRVHLYRYNFSRIESILKVENIGALDGIFVDLGVSSYQFDETDAGFSFKPDTHLDMRMDKNGTLTAADIVNTFEEDEIANIIYEFGEERRSRAIARAIVKLREQTALQLSQDLIKAINMVTPAHQQNQTARRVFQALRIRVNDELENLKVLLEKGVGLLAGKGRIVVLTYHSLEDRIVKEFFRFEELECICPPDFPVCSCNKEQRLRIVTKKPVTPSKEEIQKNSRARSAKLRVAERV